MMNSEEAIFCFCNPGIIRVEIKSGNPPGGRRVAHQRGAAGQVDGEDGGTREMYGFPFKTGAGGSPGRGTQATDLLRNFSALGEKASSSVRLLVTSLRKE